MEVKTSFVIVYSRHGQVAEVVADVSVPENAAHASRWAQGLWREAEKMQPCRRNRHVSYQRVGDRELGCLESLAVVLPLDSDPHHQPSNSENAFNAVVPWLVHKGSQVPSQLRLLCAILSVESMEIGTYHFTRVPSPKS
jgi:hypothetical protein